MEQPGHVAASDVADAWHRRLTPHLDQLARIIEQFETLRGERLAAVLRAALDCTDDDLLPLIVDSEALLYPAVERTSHGRIGACRMLRIDQHIITELRHELRGRLVGDIDDEARAVIRERLYGLHLLLRGQVAKHEELRIAALAAHDDPDPRGGLAIATTPTACSDAAGTCGCGHGEANDDRGEAD